MTKEREALKLALEALKELRMLGMNMQWHDSWLAKSETAITAIREVLAQPEPSELDIWKSRALQAEAVIEKFMAQPEPVIDKSAAVRIATSLGWEPKRTWVGLTDEEIKNIIGPWGDTPIKGYTRKLFDQIEAKLKEKNSG